MTEEMGAKKAAELDVTVKSTVTPKRRGAVMADVSLGREAAPDTATQETKRDQLVRMLRRKAGADVPTISGKMGWQAHSTRAALSGLRKAGFELEATKPKAGDSARYRIVAEPATEKA